MRIQIQVGLIVLLTLAAAPPVAAHPTFSEASVVNSASFTPPELPGGAVARGSIFTVFGSQLGPQQGVQATSFPLPLRMSGVSIEVSQPGAETVFPIPLFAIDGQLNAIMPSDAPLGNAALVVIFDDADGRANSPPIRIRVVEAGFGIFTINASGRGHAVANNFNSETDQPLNSTLESVRPGQFVTLWGTGLGAIAGADNLPPAEVGGIVDLQQTSGVEVWVGGLRSPQIFYAGRSAEFSGLDQIVFQVPANAPIGCYVPVWVKTKGGNISNSAALSIAADGGTCSDPLNPYLAPEIGDRMGAAVLTRLLVDVGAEDARDTGTAVFQTLVNRAWFFNPAVSLPPEGTCTVYTERNAPGGTPNVVPASPLDAGGALIVRGPAGSRFLTRTDNGFHTALFGTTRQNDAFLEPGAYTVESSGGGNIGAFNGQVALAQPPQWTLSGPGTLVERAAGMTITWPAGDTSNQLLRVMLVSASTANPSNTVTATLLCNARADQGSLTVSPDALANLPLSAGSGVSSTAVLYVGFTSIPSSARFMADGLDYGFLSSVALRGKLVDVR